MKTRISIGWTFGMVWAVMAAAHGFAQHSLNPPPTTPPSAATGAAALAPDTGPASQSPPAAPPEPGNAANTPAAPVAPLSARAQEVQRLTQAGLDERVIMAFIANSPGSFDLRPDNIIHLQNLGLSPTAINAMLLHDQALIASNLRMTRQASAPPATIVTPLDPPGHPQIIANDDDWASEALVLNDYDYAPEQPEGVGPVRVPYPVKLNDPIIVFRLPTFRVQCW